MDPSAPKINLHVATASLSDDSAYKQDGVIKGWESTATLIQWDVQLRATGVLEIYLGLANDEENINSAIKVAVGENLTVGQTTYSGGWDSAAPMYVGQVQIHHPGLHTVTVQAQGIAGIFAGELHYVTLTGPPALRASEDVIPLNADAVHLSWGLHNIAIFYNSISIEKSYPGTSFVACGSNDGFLGLQHLDFDGHKQVIFCVWDAYRGRGNDPDIVPDIHRVIMIEKNPVVTAERFGKDGTGIRVVLPYAWQKGEVYHFALEAQVTEDYSQIAGYFFINESNQWMKIGSFRVRDDQKMLLTGIHSSVEDWRGSYGRHDRKAMIGPAWIRSAGEWKQIMSATFTQSGDLKNTNTGLFGGEKFFLNTGGRTVQDMRPGNRIFGIKPSKYPSILNKLTRPKSIS